ncbi:MAG: DUF1616 domain-containing protein [Candidatus Bathyarchaeia archaeon]
MNAAPSIRTFVDDALRKHPATVGELVREVQSENDVDEVDLFDTIKSMVHEQAIALLSPTYEIATFLDYLFTITLSGWLWATLIAIALTLPVVAITPDIFPLNVPRWALGSIFVLFLPGYSLLQLLFPKESDLDMLERFALDVGVSLALVPLIGLMLNFTPWGIRLIPIMASLAGFTIIVSVGAAVRKYWAVRVEPV